MARKKVLCEQPVHRLLQRMALLAPAQRRQAWGVYAKLRRLSRTGVLGQSIQETTGFLVRSVAGNMPYSAVTLAVKLAQVYTEQHLSLCGAPCRAERAHLRESYFLIRRGLRGALGLRTLAIERVWKRGKARLRRQLGWLAVCDGSCKSEVSSAGVLVYDSSQSLRAEIGLSIQAETAVDAELRACSLALETLLALGARRAAVQVDSVSVLSGLSRKLPLRYCVQEAELAALAARFQALEVRLVPRVTTYEADRLAARFSRNGSE